MQCRCGEGDLPDEAISKYNEEIASSLSLLATTDRDESMQACELAQLIARQNASDEPYLEFLNVPDLSMGLYVLPAGGTDPQSPHTEDEVYYVVSGRAKIQVAEEDRAVQAGSIVYVAKNVEHRFHSIEEELTVLVFFAPAEYSNKQSFFTRREQR
ncbi:MAG TPA: cupin domain-containing protein [Anaerolineales bacterium]|nr:cupin domain-containing protein [Anaerolineales bacterium]